MAAATTAIIAGSAMALGAAQTVSGAVEKGKAKKAINNYDRQELTNSYENMAISTRGSNLMKEEGIRTVNQLSNSVLRGGSRAITGNIGRIAATSNDVASKAAMTIDQQVLGRNEMIARENQRIQQMYEQREREDLAGLGAMHAAGNETMWNGMSAIQSAVGYGANNGLFDKKDS